MRKSTCPSSTARQARAVPVLPRPPPHATSTRSSSARRHTSQARRARRSGRWVAGSPASEAIACLNAWGPWLAEQVQPEVGKRDIGQRSAHSTSPNTSTGRQVQHSGRRRIPRRCHGLSAMAVSRDAGIRGGASFACRLPVDLNLRDHHVCCPRTSRPGGAGRLDVDVCKHQDPLFGEVSHGGVDALPAGA